MFSDLVPIPGVELAVESTGPVRVHVRVHTKKIGQTTVFRLAELNVYQPFSIYHG